MAKLKNSKLQKVMQLDVLVVRFIVARPLNHRQFRQLLEEYESENGD